MNVDRARLLSQLRCDDGWVAQIRSLATALRTSTRRAGGLLIVGPPTDEPWHLVAHLEQESRLAGLPQLAPTLVRHFVPAGAAPHLAVDLSRLNAAQPGETVFVVAPVAAPAELLSRVQDARHAGATIVALEAGGDRDLQGLAHETVTIGDQLASGSAEARGTRGDIRAIEELRAQFATAQHLVSTAAGQDPARIERRGRLFGVIRK